MPRPIHIQFSLGITPPVQRWLLVVFVLFFSAVELGSESVTLTTYYPAPSGVYNKMITTNDTYIVRDGGRLVVGDTSQYPGAPFNRGAFYVNGTSVLKGSSTFAGNVWMRGTAAASGKRGYLYIDNAYTGCSLQSPGVAGNANVCGVGYYATWTPGVYIEGTSIHDTVGVTINFISGASDNRVWALHPVTGNPEWGTVTAGGVSSNVRYYCCLK